MTVFRFIAFALPQILVLLLLGGWLDLLGGFNHTDAGFGVLIILFVLNPAVTFILLVVEAIKYRKFVKHNQGTGSLRWRNIAIFLLVETFATNLFILSQVKLH